MIHECQKLNTRLYHIYMYTSQFVPEQPFHIFCVAAPFPLQCVWPYCWASRDPETVAFSFLPSRACFVQFCDNHFWDCLWLLHYFYSSDVVSAIFFNITEKYASFQSFQFWKHFQQLKAELKLISQIHKGSSVSLCFPEALQEQLLSCKFFPSWRELDYGPRKML